MCTNELKNYLCIKADNMRVAIVNNSTLKIHHIYESDEINYDAFMCALGDPCQFTHIIIPDSIPNVPDDILTCVNMDDILVIQINQDAYIDYADKQIQTAWKSLRILRNELLKETDWTQIQDVNIESNKKEEWRIYRQALRDLPLMSTNPNDIIWPEKPQ